MISLLKRFSLPLLLKELLEQAARRRTYIIRVIYATLFFLACMMIILPEVSRAGASPLGVLGIGHNIFIGIIGWQFAGIYLFLPALACSVLTVEKERNTLGLLFLTKLGQWTIVFEKLLSRLLPMYCLILCSLPLLAFSMSLGGVNLSDLFIGVWFLSLTAFQVCAIAVACSAVMRTTTGALLTCYVVMFVVGFGPSIVDWLVFDGMFSRYLQSFTPTGIPGEMILFAFVGFVGFIAPIQVQFMGARSYDLIWFCLQMGVPLVGSGLFALLIARLCLVRRAFVPASNPVLYLLRMMDRTFHALNNNRVTRGIVIIHEASSEPGYSPIAWRETQKRSLGQTRYLIRILLALELPVLLIIILVISRSATSYNNAGAAMTITTMIVWLIAVLLITVTSASLISGERGRQTLDILLTLPLDGHQIIQDKIAGVTRLAWVCAVPLVTSICFEAWWRDVVGYQSWGGRSFFLWDYLLTALSMVAIYLPLMIWLALWVGLKTKSPTRATLAALIAVVGWCVIPLIAVSATWQLLFAHRGAGVISSGYGMALQFSPVFLFYQSEFESLQQLGSPFVPLMFNVLIYGFCLRQLRSRVLASADQLLGRNKVAPYPKLTFHWATDSSVRVERFPSVVHPGDDAPHA